MSEATLYERLGGYDGIASVANDLMPRVMSDPRLGRFYRHRGEDGLQREKQLLTDFLCSATGGAMVYTGRDMKTTHVGMQISKDDWSALMRHLHTTLDKFEVPDRERTEVVAFIESTKGEMVEC